MPISLVCASTLACEAEPAKVDKQANASQPKPAAEPKPVAEPKPAVELKPADEPPPVDPVNDKDCLAEPTWLTSPSQPDGALFNDNSNCAFHRWAYQTFLWLVSKDAKTGQLVFEGFANPKDLFMPNGPKLPYPGRADGSSVDMLARMSKSSTSADIEDIFQAGPGNKALIDQAANVIYYANHLDETYWNFAVAQKLFDVEVLTSLDPTLDFPNNTLELKTSWRIARIEGSDPIIPDAASRFYVVETEVPTVAPDKKGVLREDHGKMRKVEMALIGMHVTGIVVGHPEFIWATFEHVDNAPDCADLPLTGAPKSWNLYDGKATVQTANQFDIGNPMAIVNVCLEHPLGGGTPQNQNAIQTLEGHVKELEGDSLWRNYVLGGAIWTSKGEVPLNIGGFSPADQENKAEHRGSIQLANTTMETFTQDQNCFTCHNAGAHEVAVGNTATEVNPKHVNLSHFVVNYQAAQQAARK